MSAVTAKKLLTAEELAERWQIVCKAKPAQAVYRMTREGKIPRGAVVRLGPRCIRFSLEGIEEFEAAGGIQGAG